VHRRSRAFDIDANGIVNVSAKDKATGREQQIPDSGIRRPVGSDIQKMAQGTPSQCGRGQERRGQSAQNHADSLVHSTEKALAEHGSKVAERAPRHRTPLQRSKGSAEGRRCQAIKAKTNTLAQAR
jgi:molecular chaperone DnaK